jgi:hypothetical protein
METLSWEALQAHLSDGVPALLSMGGKKGVQLGYAAETRRIFVRLPVVPGTPTPPQLYAELNLRIIHTDRGPMLEISSGATDLQREFHRFAGLLTEDFEKPGRTALEAFATATERWRELTTRREGMSTEQQVGLWGELYFLRALVAGELKGLAVEAWTGRGDSVSDRHDFRFAGIDVEVKTTRRSTRQHVIHGLTQLLPSIGHDLYLISLRLDAAGAGTGASLSDLVFMVRSALGENQAARKCFEDKLKWAKYVEADAAFYVERFKVADSPMLVPITSPFPRIIPSAIAHEVPAQLVNRISDVSYRVDLEGLGFAYGTPEFAQVMGTKILFLNKHGQV